MNAPRPSADIDPAILEALIAVRGHAYAPYSRHPVGAAVISESGACYAGANVEVAHYKGLCAEASAIAALISAGKGQAASSSR